MSEKVEVKLIYQRETDNAYGFSDEDRALFWLPKSLAKILDGKVKGVKTTVEMPEWLAEKHELEGV